ncbi:MAG: hypothetical protein ACYSUI_24255 [Planctomycetota bacterium]
MRKSKFKRGPKRPRPQMGTPPTMGRFDFEPMMPFLRARLPEHHPVYRAAMENDLAAFMAALRDVGDGRLNHDIAGELERMSRSAPPS